MTTWATIESDITGILTTASLSRLPENQDAEQASSIHETGYYALKPIAIENQNLTSSGGLGSYLVRLEVTFINLTSSARATNFDTFASVCNSLINLGRFNGFEGNATFEDVDNKKSIARVDFYYGVRDC